MSSERKSEKIMTNENKKINVRKVKNILFIDTETIMDLANAMPFDIGYLVYDNRNNKELKSGTCLVRKFINNKYIMLSSWSANKYYSHYKKIMNEKNVKVESVKVISDYFTKLIKKYDIKYMVAHNGTFDIRVLKKLFKEHNVKNPFENLDLIDTMEMSFKTISTTKKYEKFCLENKDITKKVNEKIESKFITNSNRVRTTAESIYSFIEQNTNFLENHTGLEDIKIELEIFKYCKNRKAIFKINFTPSWNMLKPIM